MENALIFATGGRPEDTAHNRIAFTDVDLDPDNWAFAAITDFAREYPITVSPERSIDDARDDVLQLGVHALVLIQSEIESAEQLVVGLITSYDIQRRQQKKQSRAGADRLRHTDLCVRDVMTAWHELPLINYESLLSLMVDDLHQRFQGTELTHFPIVESHNHDSVITRGLISRAAVSKRLRRASGVWR